MSIKKPEFFQAEQFIKEGQYDKALHIIESLVKKDYFTLLDNLTYSQLKSTILIKIGQFDDALKLAEYILIESQKLEQPLLEVDGYTAKAEALFRLGKLEESLDVISQCEHLLDTLDPKLHDEISLKKAYLLKYKGIVYVQKGLLDQSLEYSKQSLCLFEKTAKKKEIAAALNTIGIVFTIKNDLEKALDYHQQSLSLKEELGNKQDIASSLSNIGIIFTKKGEFELALEYHQRSLQLEEEIGNKMDISASLNNIGAIYQQRGEWTQALDFHHRGLEIDRKIGNKLEIARSLNNIGLIYWKNGDLKQAFAYLEECKSLMKEIGNELELSSVLFHLISVALDQGDLDKGCQYLGEIEHLSNDDILILQHKKVARALILGQDKDKWEEAKKELEQILEEGTISIELSNYILLILCEILLNAKEPLVKEAQNHINRLFETAQKQNSSWLLAGVFILQAKQFFIDFRQSRTLKKDLDPKKSIEKALQLSHEKKYYIVLYHGYLLLAQLNAFLGLFFLDLTYFAEAEEAIQKIKFIINQEQLVFGDQKVQDINQQIGISKQVCQETLNLVTEDQRQKQEIEKIEQQFIDSIDEYLQLIKITLSS